MGNLKRTDKRAAAVGDTVVALGTLGTGKALELIVALERMLSSETAVQTSIQTGVGRAGVKKAWASRAHTGQPLSSNLPLL